MKIKEGREGRRGDFDNGSGRREVREREREGRDRGK